MIDKTLNDILNPIIEMEDMNAGEKLVLFCALVDCESIVKELCLKAQMIKFGMDTESKVAQFSYAVLRIVRPDLFEQDEITIT